MISQRAAEDVIQATADWHGITVAQMKSHRNLRQYVAARREAAMQLHDAGLADSRIGFLLGDFERSTIYNLRKPKGQKP